jgi:drug/metabolite transporter (DMT)-like permease
VKRGVLSALLAAALFGLSAPLGKLLLGHVPPQLLAGLLYLGAGMGLSLVRLVRPRRPGESEPPLRRNDAPLLAGVILFGGVLGPLLLLLGLSRVSALTGSLLLNLEAPFTMALAVLFGEHLGRRAALAGLLVVGGSALLGLGSGAWGGQTVGALAIAGACLSWGLDNNLTQRLSSKDPIVIVQWKTLGAGLFAVPLALLMGARLPSAPLCGAALALGLFSYGASIVLDVWALRLLGAAREAPLFATAPFVGALAAIPLLGDRPRLLDLAACALMVAGVWLLIREKHGHLHHHDAVDHEHAHTHDDPHHQHAHPDGQAPPPGVPHSHPHHHDALEHDHPHVPDLHHRHKH